MGTVSTVGEISQVSVIFNRVPEIRVILAWMSFEISSPQFSKSDLGDWSSIKDIEPSPSKPRFFGLTESALGLLSGSREKPSTSPPPAGPRWVPDSEASVCFCCEDAFSFKHRRHHCRSCGNVVCRSCSGSRLHLASMGFGAPQRACDICVAAFELFRAGESLSRISGFLNWFLGTETCLSVAERKEALVLQVSEEQQQNLVEPEKFLRMNGMSSLMAFDHLAQTKALEFEQQEEEDEKEENETIALYKTGVAIAQSRIRTKLSSGILSSASSESIRSEDSVCFEEYLMKEALNRRMAIASEFPLPETAEKDDASLKNVCSHLLIVFFCVLN